jgi:acyl carrier protein
VADELDVKTLAELLNEIRPEFDFAASQDFLADGMLDSFDMVALVATLDEVHGIAIEGVDIVPVHFRNLDTISALLSKYGITP